MRKFIFKIIYWVAFCSFINLVFLVVLVKFEWESKKIIEIKNLRNSKYKIIALGNSLILDGLDARFLTNKGLPTYNFGLAGATLRTQESLLIEYLKNNDQPDFIIYGLSSCKDFLDLSSDKKIPILSVEEPLNYVFTDNGFPLNKFKWKLSEIAKPIFSKYHREMYVDLGQLKTKKAIPDHTKYSNNRPTPNFKNNKFRAYLPLINLCKARGIKIIFVDMPGRKSSRYNIKETDGRISLFDCPVYLLNSVEFCGIFLDNEDWLTDDHLNQFGAEKFTNQLYQVLTKSRFF
jgi:hypothetical protein